MIPRAFLVTDAEAEAGGPETLIAPPGLAVISRQELADSDIDFRAGQKVAIATEAAMESVVARLDDDRRRVIATLKDKAAFRRVLADDYPDVTCETVATADLASVRLDPDRRYVVKPALGVFGTAVRTIEGSHDLDLLRDEITAEVAAKVGVLSASALSSDRLVIERYIDGEEYAVDAFFDADGEPVVTGAFHHPMPAIPAYLHMAYVMSAAIHERVAGPAEAFFRTLAARLGGIRNLAMHAEFRMERGRLVPIEINSMRFGGMGLGNMAAHVVGVNAYDHFVHDTRPDWTALHDDAASFVFFIAYNGTSVDVERSVPDWDALRARFSDIALEVPFDHRRQLAFGILYAREPADRVAELLEIEFDDLFVPA